MQVALSNHNSGTVVVSVSGRIDATTSDQFKQQLMETISDRPIQLILDFAQLEFISSIGLRVLVVTAKRVAAVRGKLVFCGLTGPVREVFELAGFVSVVPLFPDRAAALASFPS
jgi:anti-anti-sigma factor